MCTCEYEKSGTAFVCRVPCGECKTRIDADSAAFTRTMNDSAAINGEIHAMAKERLKAKGYVFSNIE